MRHGRRRKFDRNRLGHLKTQTARRKPGCFVMWRSALPRWAHCTELGLTVTFSITTTIGCDSALACMPATVLPSTTTVVATAMTSDIRRACVEIVFIVGPLGCSVRFVSGVLP